VYAWRFRGVKGGQAATVAYIFAGLLALLSLAGLWHAFKTPKDQAFATPEPTNGKVAADKPPLVNV
jgi:chromate transport protein ChrA